jgi:hypothetical protein
MLAVMALSSATAGCGDDHAVLDAALPDAAVVDAMADGATDARPDAPVDAAVDAMPDAMPDAAVPLSSALDPTFGQGGSYTFPAVGGMGAITSAPGGDIVACGPSRAVEDLNLGAAAWLGRVDGGGVGPGQVWVLGPTNAHESCASVAVLTSGHVAVVTASRLLIRDVGGGPVAELPFDVSHRLLQVAAAPDGGLWAVGVEGLWRYDGGLSPVAAFGVGGLVAMTDAVGLAVHGANLTTARVTVATRTRQVRRVHGDSGAPDLAFAGTGTTTVPIPAGWPGGELRAIVARADGGVAVMTDWDPPDAGTHYGVAPVTAAGVAGPSVSGSQLAIGSAAVDASDRVWWPSSEGFAFLDQRLFVTRTDPTVTSTAAIMVVPPPATATCRYAAAGAVVSGGIVVGYSAREVAPPLPLRYSARVVRLAP